MIAFLDVDYQQKGAVAACVLARDWIDSTASAEFVEHISHVEPYVPGEFYRRELPCLLAVLGRVSTPLETVVIDGYVWLGGVDRPGLGAHVFEALDKRVSVVGVAKTEFHGAELAVPVVRGATSLKPLFVTAIGINPVEAACHIAEMHGTHRLPTLIKRADFLCRHP